MSAALAASPVIVEVPDMTTPLEAVSGVANACQALPNIVTGGQPTAAQLEAAIAAFRTRDRRFGRLPDTKVEPGQAMPGAQVSGTAAAQSR